MVPGKHFQPNDTSMIKLFSLKKEKDEASAAAAAGGAQGKKTTAAELRIQKGLFNLHLLNWLL